MAKNLVIVESPSKGKTIEKFLGPDYKVVASMGHIRDLPQKTLGIDIENGFMPVYEISEGKVKTVNELKKLAKKHDSVLIATDEDREGEAIGWHLCHALSLNPAETKRIVFHEITKTAITKAIEAPRTLDIALVDAQQARRLLDRLVGYKVSPILWQKIRKGLSAGRVQSVAVKLIVEREREIQAFIPKESWALKAELNHQGKTFKAEFHKLDGKVKKLLSQADTEKLLSVLGSDINKLSAKKNSKNTLELHSSLKLDFILKESIVKDSKRSPGAPFTTSTLQQEASRKYGFSVKQTMSVAQKLYEGMDLGNGEREGLITYMRTDSLFLSDLAKKQAASVIEEHFGKEYQKTRNYKTKSSGAQEAHEAIRPTNLARTPESLKGALDPQQYKLYTLIWKRTLASQMEDAIVEVTSYHLSPSIAESQSWLAKGEVIRFDGFMKLYIEGNDDEEEEVDDGLLPLMSEGDIAVSQNISGLQNFSRPPARYTEASLVKKLESEGIGRPSTYAPTISTIIDRGYVEKNDKKQLEPTEIAPIVNDFLEEHFKDMMQYSFTKNIEEEFDKVAEGKLEYQVMLEKFYTGSLQKNITSATENAEKIVQKVGRKCPSCKEGDLIYKFSKGGKFIGCSNYPECKHIEQPEEEKTALDALKAKYEGRPCPDGVEGTIVVKTGRFGPFLASSEYPRVKWIGKIKSEKDELLEEILQKRGLLVDEETGEEMVVKGSKRGPFLAAKRYPEVKIAKNIPKDVWEELNNRLTENTEA
ncbi:type I DNA topoisomerase [Candidatus Gracilibacteria bacterium]|nr:type I DNA topoisomerase [Candidatus Gracilibacteria bacterium]